MGSFTQFYLQHEYSFAAIQLALAMLGMGATLTGRDFMDVLAYPRSFLIGLVIQLAGVSAIAFAAMSGMSLETGVVIGMAICAAVPGGTTSNIFTHIGRGNTALSVSLTTVCSLVCLLTAPLILSVLLASDLPEDFAMPAGTIAFDILINLLIPLTIGMILLRYSQRIAIVVSVWSIRLSLLVIVGIVVGAAGAGRLDLQAFGMVNVWAMVGFITVLMLVSITLPRLLSCNMRDTVAIAMEVTVRNINLGLLVHVALFASGIYADEIANQALLAMLLYGALQLLMCIPLIAIGRRFAERV